MKPHFVTAVRLKSSHSLQPVSFNRNKLVVALEDGNISQGNQWDEEERISST